MKITVYYDYHEGKLAPMLYVVSFRKGQFDWSKNTVYIPIEAPFQQMGVEDFIPDSLGITVTLGELTLHYEKPGKFGIYLSPLRQRAVESGMDYWDVEQLIIRVEDLEDLMHINLFREGIAS